MNDTIQFSVLLVLVSQELQALQRCGAFSISASDDEFKIDSDARSDYFEAILAA